MRKMLLVVVSLALVGCGEDPLWTGTYASTGTWKLSGPLEGGRTVGDAAADLLLDKLVSAAPVPSFLEGKLRDWLSGAIRDEVKSTIDSKVPKDLAPDGAITKLLGETLASVQVESTISLGGDSDELEGTETITAVEYVIRGQRRRVAAAELAGQAGASIVATWAGEEANATTLTVEPHSVMIRYGALVRLILGDLLQAADLGVLDGNLRSALGCQAIVAVILDGRPGFDISIAGWTHTISAADLASYCDAAMSKAQERAAGQFELDSHVQVGGSVSWAAVPGSMSIELKSAPGFGGIVTVLPDAIAPKVTVSFTARRQ